MPARPIETFAEINDLHASTGYAGRTDLASFHVFPLDRGCETVRSFMPPHRRRFYQATLLQTATGVSFDVDGEATTADHDLLLFAAPRQVISWTRSEAQSGWVIYFHADFLGLTDLQLEQRFHFFQPGEVNRQAVPEPLLARIRGFCNQLVVTFEERQPYRLEVLRSLFTAFLYESLSLYSTQFHPSNRNTSEAIFWRFRNLLDRNFLTHRTVNDYAKLMRLTPGHLSEVVRQCGGQSASRLIAARLRFEAQQLLRHTDLPIAEVSAHLQFSEPTHFTRFFRRMTGQTPSDFRESGQSSRNPG